jgi:hypothetical protein
MIRLFNVGKFSEKNMKITKQLIEKMVREELNNLDEGGMSHAADWSLPRQLASLVRLVGGNPGPNASNHRAAMDIINSMIAKHGTDDGSTGLAKADHGGDDLQAFDALMKLGDRPGGFRGDLPAPGAKKE